MKILHICAGWEPWNGAANIARMVMGEQTREGNVVSAATWAGIGRIREADEIWIHCAWKPCLWWAALWGRKIRWMPEGSYDPVRLSYHGWKKRMAGPMERFFLRHADRIIVTCGAEREWVQAYLGERCPPVEVTDIRRFFTFPSASPSPITRPLHLLYLGRRHPLKDIDDLQTAATAPEMDGKVELRIESSAFGEEKEQVWAWCDVLVLPTLSDNFGLVVAEALERDKRVITTDGAPAWEDTATHKLSDTATGTLWSGYDGWLLYLKGYRNGTRETRIELLKAALASCTDTHV